MGLLLLIVSPWLAERMVFYPVRADPGTAPTLGDVQGRDVTFATEDGFEIHAWWFDLGGGAPTVVFFHGNAGNIAGRAPLAEGLVRRGVSVLLPDYRGYGRSQGEPSEEGIYRDGEAALAFLREHGAAPGRTVVMGRSLGGAVAIRLAAGRELGGLVVEAAFTSLDEMAKAVYPLLPSFLFLRLRGRFDNLTRIGRVSSPVLVIHGEEDDLVPVRMGRALYEAAPEPKTWYPVTGAGHNDTWTVGGADYFERLAAFVNHAAGIDPGGRP